MRVASDKMPGGRLAIRLRKEMSQLAGEPVTAVGRVNVVGLTTFKGMAIIIWAGSCIWSISTSQNLLYVGGGLALAVDSLAWAVLRRQRGPLRLGLGGAVMGVSPTTLYVAQLSFWTGRTTQLLGRWPRDQVSMTPVDGPPRRMRRFDLLFPTASATSHLELVQNRDKSAALRALFGNDSKELTVTPVAGKPWGPGWTTLKKDE